MDCFPIGVQNSLPMIQRPPTPIPSEDDFIMPSLRTPSDVYNHGGYYGPINPRECNGPCATCQQRIDEEEAVAALLALSSPRPKCCETRPEFLEPCPVCESSTLVSHSASNLSTCNGCEENVCTQCFAGARYYCPLINPVPKLKLPVPLPASRQQALGVKSPKSEEKKENK